MKNIGLLLLIALIPVALPAQPSIQWQKCLGGTNAEEANSIQQTSDGGYIVAGNTLSNDGDVSGYHGYSDFWVVKLNSAGNLQWQRTLGGSSLDFAYAVQQTNDGGFIVAGFTESTDGDVLGNHGDKDVWLVKLSAIGTIEWQKCLGGSGWDEASSVRQTSDGGYVVAGQTSSSDGDVSGYHGTIDFWVVKLSGIGIIEWEKALGGSLYDIAYSVKQTPDGGYIVAGESDSNNGDASGLIGSSDFWVVKLSPAGVVEWQKMLGSTSLDRANEICPTNDGGYIVTGLISWGNGDVNVHHGGFDYWVVKLNPLGEIQWEKTLGGSNQDYARSVQQTRDGGYVIAGYTPSTDGDVVGNDGGIDVWVVKLTEGGAIQWQKTFGGTQAERAHHIQQTSEEGYIVSGHAKSNNGDVSGFHGVQDFWVVKLSPESSPTTEASTLPLEIFPNPATNSISLTIPTEEPILSLSITDLLGQELRRETILDTKQIDVSALPWGLYFLKATAPSGKVFAGKFIKGAN